MVLPSGEHRVTLQCHRCDALRQERWGQRGSFEGSRRYVYSDEYRAILDKWESRDGARLAWVVDREQVAAPPAQQGAKHGSQKPGLRLVPAAARKPAVSRPALTNGRVDKPIATLDLCAQHQRELLRYFLPRRATARPSAGIGAARERRRDRARPDPSRRLDGQEKEPVTRGDVARMPGSSRARGAIAQGARRERRISARGKTAARRYTVRGEKQ